MQLILDADPPQLARVGEGHDGQRFLEFLTQGDDGRLHLTTMVVLNDPVTASTQQAIGAAVLAVMT